MSSSSESWPSPPSRSPSAARRRCSASPRARFLAWKFYFLKKIMAWTAGWVKPLEMTSKHDEFECFSLWQNHKQSKLHSKLISTTAYSPANRLFKLLLLPEILFLLLSQLRLLSSNMFVVFSLPSRKMFFAFTKCALQPEYPERWN